MNDQKKGVSTSEVKTPIESYQKSAELSIEEKVKFVNDVLRTGEPNNVSHDTYSGYTGYKPQFVIDAMNKVFGIGNWGFEEIQTEVAQDKDSLPQLAIVQVKVWLKNIGFMPVGWGQSRITRGDLGDAKKGAQTDAIKKALSYFSIGNRAYHGLLGNGKSLATQDNG